MANAELDAPVYVPRDDLSLWWLGDPAHPILVGQVSLVRANRSVSLRYDASWLRSGFALSEDLPLTPNAREALAFMPVRNSACSDAAHRYSA